MMAMLEGNREKRAAEEKARQDQLRREWQEQKRREEEELAKELAVINARKALEEKAKDINRDEFVADAIKKMEAELDFSDFAFKF